MKVYKRLFNDKDTAAERLATFNLVKIFLICHLVVDKEIFSTSPISLLLQPFCIKAKTSYSLAVKSSKLGL